MILREATIARRLGVASAVLAAVLAGRALPAQAPAAEAADPLAAEIERWRARIASESSADDLWVQVKTGAGPVLDEAGKALREGHRGLALLRLAAARENLGAAAFVVAQPEAAKKDQAVFEAEWARAGERLRSVLAPPAPDALAGVEPALTRALAEAALHQVRVYYDASLDYSRSTSPDYGLFYVGAAEAQRDFVAFLRALPAGRAGPAGPPLRLRSLAPELEALEGELLAAYRPPASVDKHRDFIVASSTVKIARELDAGGLRYGALLRYLQAVQRVTALRKSLADGATAPAGDAGRKSDVPALEGDSSLADAFVELAEAEQAKGDPAGTAALVRSDVLPRYLAALRDPEPRPARPEPRATVTLVRWPYT